MHTARSPRVLYPLHRPHPPARLPRVARYAAPDVLGEFAYWQEASQERLLQAVGAQRGLVAVISVAELTETLHAVPALTFPTMQAAAPPPRTAL